MNKLTENKFIKKIQSCEQLGLIVVLVLLATVVSIKNSNFLSIDNIINVMRSTSFVFIIGIAITFVLITGGLDLSVGAVMAFAGVISALVAQQTESAILSLIVGLALGACIGIANGFFIVKLKIPALIVTLGMMYVCEGLVSIITKGSPVYPLPANFIKMGSGKIFGIPIVIIIAIVLALIAMFVLKRTTYGRQVYALGGNRETSRLAGISVDKIQISVYVIASIAAAFAGILMAGRMNSAQPSAGAGYELTVVAAVIIGGTSMFGGSGGIGGTALGAILLTVIETALLMMKISGYWQSLIVGIIIILAVGLDQYRRKKHGISN